METFLKLCGALQLNPEKCLYHWRLYTRAGHLDLTIADTNVFGRFEDMFAGQVASRAIGKECGATGKWNFHWLGDISGALQEFAELVERLLEYNPTQDQIVLVRQLRAGYVARHSERAASAGWLG